MPESHRFYRGVNTTMPIDQTPHSLFALTWTDQIDHACGAGDGSSPRTPTKAAPAQPTH